jgi:hypothetical protein
MAKITKLPAYLTTHVYNLLAHMEGKLPQTRDDLLDQKFCRRTVNSAARKGLVHVGHGGWVSLTETGAEMLAYVRSLPQLPKYAGGPVALSKGGRRKKVEDAPLALPAPEPEVEPGVNPFPQAAPTTMSRPECIAALSVRLEVDIEMLLGTTFDAQAVRAEVQRTIAEKGVSAFMRGWDIRHVLVGDTEVYSASLVKST